MTTLLEALDGLVAQLETIDGLRVYDRMVEDVHYPAAIVVPPVNTDYRNDLSERSFTVRFVVLLMVPAVVDRRQLDLYTLLDRGPGSVFAAVDADRTLGGLDVDARVVSANDPLDLSEMAGTLVYQRAVLVEVIVS